MRRIILLLCLTSSASAWTAASLKPAQNAATTDEETKKEVLKVEDERIQSHQKKDRAAMDRIYSNDLVWTFPTGERFTKSQFMDIILNGRLKPFVMSNGEQKEVTTIKQEDRHFYAFGNTVVVTRFAPMTELYDGKPLPHPRRFFNVYVKIDGQWQLVTHHSTPVAKQ